MSEENIDKDNTFIAKDLMDAADQISKDMVYKEDIRDGIWFHVDDTPYEEFYYECHRMGSGSGLFDFMMPDDYRYQMINKALDIISNYEDERDYCEGIDENVPIYTSELLEWLASRSNRYSYVEDAVSDYGIDTNNFDLIRTIGMGYYKELEEVLYLAKGWIEDNFTFEDEDDED